MSKQSAINYLERRKIELSDYMSNMSCEKERQKVFKKYIDIYTVIEHLKEEK